MTARTNPLQQPIRALFQRLNLINGLLFFLEARSTDVRNLVTQSLKNNRERLPTVFTSCSLSVLDLSAVKYAPCASGGFMAKDQSYIDAIDEIVRRNSAATVSQAYEAFETYLKDQLANFYFAHPADADSKKLSDFGADKKAVGLDSTQLSYWRAYVTYACHGSINNDKYFRLIRKLAPDFATAEKSNVREIELTEWYAAASEVRHAVTHADFTIKPARIDGWNSDRRRNLFAWFSVEPKVPLVGNRLRIDRKCAERALSIFGDYAFQVFKHLSLAKRYKWDLFNEQI